MNYARQRTKEIYDEGGYRNSKKYNGFCNKLEEYLSEKKKKDILFSEITTAFLSKFETHLHTLKNVRNDNAKLHHNTISLIMRWEDATGEEYWEEQTKKMEELDRERGHSGISPIESRY